MILSLPPCEDDKPEIVVFGSPSSKHHEWIKRWLLMPTWHCPACNLKNDYLNKACANFRCKHPNPNGVPDGGKI